MGNPLKLVTIADQIIEPKPLPPMTAREQLAGMAPPRPVEVISHRLVRTERLVLRPLTETDRDEFVRVLFASREHLRGLVPMFAVNEGGVEESPAEAFERQLERTKLGERHGTAWRRVALTPEGRIVGAVLLRNIERGLTHQAELTVWTAADALRRGYAEESVDAMLRFAFMDLPVGLGLHRVTAAVRPDNAACRSLLLKLGLRPVPGARQKLEIDGDWIDHDTLALDAPAGAAGLDRAG